MYIMEETKRMKVGEIRTLLGATLLTEEVEEIMEHVIKNAYASDLMSEVLANTHENDVLITGLNNMQVIRTSEMMDIPLIIFVRGKKPSEEMVRMAQMKGICVLASSQSMFNCCGILYEAGIRGGTGYGE